MKTLYESILDTDFDIKEPDTGFPNADELIDIFMDDKWEAYDVRPEEKHWAYRYTGNGNAIRRDFKDFLMDLHQDLGSNKFDSKVQRDALVIFRNNEIEVAYFVNSKDVMSLKMSCVNSMQPTFLYIDQHTKMDYKYKSWNFKVPHAVIDVILWCLESKKR